ncbi:ComF family protein [Tenacibaculum sp. S7007]|uniref:ComF family protein n=1 Tax=Tenacibaculum pelagium TaxID=2759527 RepID=A0A839APA5_9FLAO|nr:ComF family protein [Tenacibaculum pelagium]MBA6156210.1 ComF family protein [Tenacibaculum pelagium]
MRFLKDIFYLFYPNLCINCTTILLQNEQYLCVGCVSGLPLIDDDEHTNVTLKSVFYGKLPVKNVRSFLYYQKHGITQKIIHQLKYKNQPEIGSYLGKWFGNSLKESEVFKDVDYIVPVPLHAKKLKKRGYNQVTSFGESLSEVLKIKYKPAILLRTSITKTQTLKQRFERFTNSKTKFKLTDKELFKNKHILLIDDVITTGATLEACCNELLKIDGIAISIATMAYTPRV